MRSLVRTAVCLAALTLLACDPPVLLYSSGDVKVSVAERAPDRLVVIAKPTVPAAFVDVHYRVNGGPQSNLRMTLEKGRWRWVVAPLAPGDIVDFFLTFEKNGPAIDTPGLRHTYGGACCGPTPSPAPTAGPTPAATPSPASTPGATPRPGPTPSPRPTSVPPPRAAPDPLTPTDYVHSVIFDGSRATIRVRPFSPLGPSTVSFQVGAESEQSRPLTRVGEEWTVAFDAAAGAPLRYSFFLSMSDGENTMFLRSATQQATIGDPPTVRTAPLTVDTAGRFRDRHENERRFEPFIEGYFEASTFAVLLLDFGDAIDVSVAVADDAEFVDIKLFDKNPTPPHRRAPEVRADYAVAARMLAHDDPETGARTWHWRQEHNRETGLDLAPGMLVDLEFTIRRVEGQPVHGGSNGQYYTAIFRHRMGEPGLTEIVTSPFARAGGTTSAYVISEPEWSFAQAARNLDHEGLVTFLRGKRLFDRDVATEEPTALGPRYDATSCAACHVRDGSAPPPAGPQDPRPGLTVGVGAPTAPDPLYGQQLQRRAVPGVAPEGQLDLRWTSTAGFLLDGTPYELVAPTATLHDLAFGPLANPSVSLRVAPRLVGLGLLEAVASSTLLALADPADEDGDGLSGRARIVFDDATGETAVGRFGWKAGAARVEQQVARAYLLDLGMTSTGFPVDDETPADLAPAATTEVTGADLDDVTRYVSTLAVPMRVDVDDPVVEQGHETFLDLGCGGCHVPTLETDANATVEALAGQVIHPFTDLLLHDMGPGLADPGGGPLAREWRTAPLWGLGRTGVVGDHTRFLHDGRARNLMEAIVWHGGEAAASRDRFIGSSAAERTALLRFLESL